jgi:hypothetical protein
LVKDEKQTLTQEEIVALKKMVQTSVVVRELRGMATQFVVGLAAVLAGAVFLGEKVRDLVLWIVESGGGI